MARSCGTCQAVVPRRWGGHSIDWTGSGAGRLGDSIRTFIIETLALNCRNLKIIRPRLWTVSRSDRWLVIGFQFLAGFLVFQIELALENSRGWTSGGLSGVVLRIGSRADQRIVRRPANFIRLLLARQFIVFFFWSVRVARISGDVLELTAVAVRVDVTVLSADYAVSTAGFFLEGTVRGFVAEGE